ncbi:hypothetical protein G7046_g1815 [Stylonectria norvegica]|nr:hypothetical protein G7046_g1815 [Stylonectria norvegica]
MQARSSRETATVLPVQGSAVRVVVQWRSSDSSLATVMSDFGCHSTVQGSQNRILPSSGWKPGAQCRCKQDCGSSKGQQFKGLAGHAAVLPSLAASVTLLHGRHMLDSNGDLEGHQPEQAAGDHAMEVLDTLPLPRDA